MAQVQVLRYPYDMITEETDYLQIDLIAKNYAGQQSGISVDKVTYGSNPNDPQRANAGKESFANLTRTRFASNTKDNRVGRTSVNQLERKSFVKTNGIILLPIPSNISDTNSIQFSEDSLDKVTALAGGLALNAMTTDIRGGIGDFAKSLETRIKQTTQGSGVTATDLKQIYLGNLAAQAAGIAGIGNITLDQLLARSRGEIVNPNMELLFKGPTIRSFKFSFKMTPRSKKEGDQVKLIIGSLKRHMAPQDSGTFLGAPNFFELRYRSGDGDHKFLHKFKQCVLENMTVNYTGENVYATYGDGTPVSIIMDLTFKELEPIYNQDYEGLGPDKGVGY